MICLDKTWTLIARMSVQHTITAHPGTLSHMCGCCGTSSTFRRSCGCESLQVRLHNIVTCTITDYFRQLHHHLLVWGFVVMKEVEIVYIQLQFHLLTNFRTHFIVAPTFCWWGELYYIITLCKCLFILHFKHQIGIS